MTIKVTYPKEVLQELAYDEFDDNLFEIIYQNLEDSSRWSLQYEMVFKDKLTDKFYVTNYSCGATESQDESPYEYEDDFVEVIEVEPKEVTVIEYFAV